METACGDGSAVKHENNTHDRRLSVNAHTHIIGSDKPSFTHELQPVLAAAGTNDPVNCFTFDPQFYQEYLPQTKTNEHTDLWFEVRADYSYFYCMPVDQLGLHVMGMSYYLSPAVGCNCLWRTALISCTETEREIMNPTPVSFSPP